MATRGWESLSADDARQVDLRRAEKARGRPPVDTRSPVCRAGAHAICRLGSCGCLCHEKQPSKMSNERSLVDGIWFDSKAEGEYWLYLKARQRKGEIRALEHHKRFPLCCPSKDRTAEHEVTEYEADFVYEEREDGHWIKHVVDKKGFRTRMYLLKRKWMQLQYGIIVEEV